MRTSYVVLLATAVLIAPLLAQTPPTAVPQGGPAGQGRPGGPGAQPPGPPPPATASNDPYAAPLEATKDVVTVSLKEFATLPDMAEAGQYRRMNLLIDEPGTKRLFVNDMRGQIYSVSYDGKTVMPYLDINTATGSQPVNSQGSERGFQSFAFHPQFTQRGAPGYGKFYTYFDTSNMTPAPDFTNGSALRAHDEVLMEWTAKDAASPTYDGGAPKELMRFAHPYGNHNGGMIAFNPLARPGSADYGLLYQSVADGGSGGDPMGNGQRRANAFGKIFRIDPLGSTSANKKYGIPASNPFAKANPAEKLGEIYAYGVRNPQRLFWDSKTGALYMAEIGQNTIEEVSEVKAGGNLGWNVWEASYGFLPGRGGVDTAKFRADATVTYPVVEYDHRDPILQGQVAVTGGLVYRATAIRQLANLMIFGDNPSGEVFYVKADALPKEGGPTAIRRILFKEDGAGEAKTFLSIIKAKNTAKGQTVATRADLRFGFGPNNQVFLLNKHDNTIRVLVP